MSPPLPIEAGTRSGMLTALDEIDRRINGGRAWLWRCDCGVEVERSNGSIRYALNRGMTSNCGCWATVDIAGQRFGRLVASSRARGRHGSWRCQCDCGRKATVRLRELRQGTTQSCGCLRVDAPSFPGRRTRLSPPFEIGMRFGRLTVAANLGTIAGLRHYLCACDCGETSTVRGTLLRNGQTRSCGCLRRDVGRKRVAALRARDAHPTDPWRWRFDPERVRSAMGAQSAG